MDFDSFPQYVFLLNIPNKTLLVKINTSISIMTKFRTIFFYNIATSLISKFSPNIPMTKF